MYRTYNFITIACSCLFFMFTSAMNAQNMNEDSQRWIISDSLSIEKIHDGIWVHTSRKKLSNGYIFPGNGMIVQNGDELILVDTAWGVEHTRELLNWIDNKLQLPVTKAIITHFHDDSMGGSPVLAEQGIPFFAHPLTIQIGKNRGIPLPEPIGHLNAGDAKSISNVEVFYPGPGHSEDNMVVWVPHAHVIFGGCAVRSPEFPGRGNVADANTENWPKAIRGVLDKYPDVMIVIPGHGNYGDAALLRHTIGLFED
jgi:glyoxylase-like metal-dependent hydrolase (beta-lactamase superfamily II)